MSTTEELFRRDAYLQNCEATVLGINELNGIILDRTVFYPTGGGQPGDSGLLVRADGSEFRIATTVYDKDRTTILHVPAETDHLPEIGEKVECRIDWQRRHSHMRAHSALHLLSAVLPYPVTGGQVGEQKGRLDFDIAEAGLDKQEISESVNKLISENHLISQRWISDDELAANPQLVKTMSVKPPSGSGKVRLVEIEGCDLQPCGGTHVAATGEIGEIRVAKIEKKGARNRRVKIELLDDIV